MFAGTLLTFIPAGGDFINAELLGNVQTGMIGSQVIQKLFLTESNYPAAAALSFMLHGHHHRRRADLRQGPRHRGAVGMTAGASRAGRAELPSRDPPSSVGHGAAALRVPAARHLGRRSCYVWLFAPIVVIVVFSFNEPAGKFNTSWNEFTFDNWLHPFRKADYTDALVTSLKVAHRRRASLAMILGGLMALALVAVRASGARAS